MKIVIIIIKFSQEYFLMHSDEHLEKDLNDTSDREKNP